MLKVAFLWHMHQPYYRDPVTGRMVLPWVRLHSIKDYYDLPARLEKYDRLKMTFNLVPSLLEQIDLYVSGQTVDRQQELTVKSAAELNRDEKAEVFGSFFTANPETMINPHPRYRRLHKKLQECGGDVELAARTSSTQEIRDLIVWGNLAWVDPIFRHRAPFQQLFEKGESFTEQDKLDLMAGQIKIMSEIVPLYRSLSDSDRIEVSFTPYFHPILPLICDTDSAREALPDITLPDKRFCHPEDAETQVRLAAEMYREKFGKTLEGMWPSEGSISEAALNILAGNGIKWTASDEQVLYSSILKSGGGSSNVSPHHVYKFKSSSGDIRLFFRDHALSDRIGFVYASWDEDKAVDDFIKSLHRLEEILGADQETVIPVVLDGENCWEYYHNDGAEFLELFFDRMNRDERIETTTFGNAAEKISARPLNRVTAGSWINHNFRIWIGHAEDNIAWDLLWQARHDLMQFKKENPEFDPDKVAAAEKSLLVAEGSDWNWWYGDEHRGPHNAVFDQIYRAHLSSIYTLLGLEPPIGLLNPITDISPPSYLTKPDGVITPEIDGRLTHYYEWLGAGMYNCVKAGGAMHRADPLMTKIYYVSDDDYIYIRTDFARPGFLIDNPRRKLEIAIRKPGQGSFLFSSNGLEKKPDWSGPDANILFGVGDIAEIGLPKKVFFPEGKGEVFFKVGLYEGDKELETWPPGDPIRFRFAGGGEEIVWDL